MQKYMQILKVICFFSPAEKCECKELALTSSKLFCTMNYAYGECVWILRTQSLPKTWFKFNAACCIFSLLPPNPTVLKVKVLSAHDKGSHAEVEVKVQKVLSQNTKVKVQRGRVTLYPESWTARGCTCPILNPGQSSVPTWFMSKEIILKYCFDSEFQVLIFEYGCNTFMGAPPIVTLAKWSSQFKVPFPKLSGSMRAVTAKCRYTRGQV